MRVLAIDPGYDRLGLAILEKNDGEDSVCYSNCFQTDKVRPFEERLHAVGKEVSHIIEKYEPNVLAIETLFFNTNQKTAMRVAEVRGMIIYQALMSNMNIFEYTPLQVKVAVTGHGQSSKKQVITMVERLISVGENAKHDDEYDAIAVGLTHLASYTPYR
jgi:crossover junction endodeoxyribonuclease RuvC